MTKLSTYKETNLDTMKYESNIQVLFSRKLARVSVVKVSYMFVLKSLPKVSSAVFYFCH